MVPTPHGRRLAGLAAIALCAAAAEAAAPMEPLLVLCGEPAAGHSIRLKLVVFTGGSAPAPEHVRVEFFHQGKSLDGPPPSARPLHARLPGAPEAGSQVHVAALGSVAMDADGPESVQVRGGAAGDRLVPLGSLRRADDGRVLFLRHWPLPSPKQGERAVLVAAAAERMGPRRFLLKLAYLNYGESFDKDLTAFVHFEFAARGEDLADPVAAGLLTQSYDMDTSCWRPGEVTVVRSRAFDVPASAPEHVYVRVGIYDRQGTQARLPLAGSDDDTGRVLVGRFVAEGERVGFEPILPALSSADRRAAP